MPTRTENIPVTAPHRNSEMKKSTEKVSSRKHETLSLPTQNKNSDIRRSTESLSMPSTGRQIKKPPVEMDKFQREVLRRKRPIIADLLDFSPASQKYYKEMGILRDDMMVEIMVRYRFKSCFPNTTILYKKNNQEYV